MQSQELDNELLESFIAQGVYIFKGIYDNIFVCTPCSQSSIGKLTQYRKNTNTMYEKTGTSYFLNNYYEGDMKEVMLNRDNYDMIGTIGSNFELSDDENYVLRKRKDD